MHITKSEYILKQLNKSKNKMYEGYVYHRLFNLLKSHDLRFSCQQYVKLANGKYALLDMYFPDLNIQIEIDEGHHHNKANIQNDEERQRFVEQTISQLNTLERNGILTLKNELHLYRITIFKKEGLKSIDEIDKDIDEVVKDIKKIIANVNPDPWNFSEEFSYRKYLNKRSINVTDNIQLKFVSDVINLFGGKKDGSIFTEGIQTRGYGLLTHKQDDEIYYWCPKKNHKDWDNQLINDGLIIKEKRYLKYEGLETKRATFFRAKDNLGNEFYRFVGVFGNAKIKGEYNFFERLSDNIEILPVQ